MTRLWDKGTPLDARVLAYTAGDDHVLDNRLVRYDIQASIAHAEMLEVQEALEDAKSSGLTDEAAEGLRAERQRLQERYQAEENTLIAGGLEWDAAVDAGKERQPLLERFKQRLAARAYLRTVIDDLTQAVGEDEGRHVTHRRH